MLNLDELTSLLCAERDLEHGQAAGAAELLASADVDPSTKRDFLVALGEKGETAAEVAAFAETFRGLAINPGVEAWAESAVDVCGTGGDGS